MPRREPLAGLHLAQRTWVASLFLFAGSTAAPAQYDSVVSTVHNLSVSGPGEVRSLTEDQVCKFCHVPHNAIVPSPLWGHALSNAEYEVPDLRSGGDVRPAPQPDGSSRLCLSCHDGTVALGDVFGEPRPIPMVGGDRLAATRRSSLGTDLSGSHPISFRLADSDSAFDDGESDLTIAPLAAILGSGLRLDAAGKMQCTTCHDPHADRYFAAGRVPRFWVRPTVDEVCRTCHLLR